MSKYKKADLSKITTRSIARRPSKVTPKELAKPHLPRSSFASFIDRLPRTLKAQQFNEFVDKIVRARRAEKPVIFMIGAHVIKVGVSPLLIDLMESGVISCLATNGAGAIHDGELTYWGKTSEDVAEHLRDGSFGMAAETGELINGVAVSACEERLGFGEAFGKRINADRPPHLPLSLFATAYRLGIPATIHVAIGTDIVHQQPGADGASIGEASMRDFTIFAEVVKDIHEGGVVLNIGSSVILPEVFLKALTVARNLAKEVRHFATANFDMLPQYRPRVNVVERPTLEGGKGYLFTGHHEIMIPLLAACIKEKIE